MTTVNKGESEEGTRIVPLECNLVKGAAYVRVPGKLVKKLGWEDGDVIELSETENCFDWGEVDSVLLRNLSKEDEDFNHE
jgi:hypothetical protein